MNQKIKIIVLFAILCLAMAGCSDSGRIDEGNCKLQVLMVDNPSPFRSLSEQDQAELEVYVMLQNINTEKTYTISLSYAAGFVTEVYLNPGSYRVLSCGHTLGNLLNFQVEAEQSNIILSDDVQNEAVYLHITDLESFTQDFQRNQISEEILQLDKFSRKVQFEGEIFDIKDILSKVPFSYGGTIASYGKFEQTNDDYMVKVEVMNPTSDILPWEQCEVTSVTFLSNNAVLGGGVRVGDSLPAISHRENGVYGLPDAFLGSILLGVAYDENYAIYQGIKILLGVAYDETYAVYQDTKSGDRITLCFSAGSSAVCEMKYELAVFGN